MSGAGKGDKPRPVDGPTYRANYDAIFRKPERYLTSEEAADLLKTNPSELISEMRVWNDDFPSPISKLPAPGSALRYPDWVCRPCGWQYGRWPGNDRISAWHEGTCGICGQRGPVSEPRDFGHLRDLPSPISQLPAPR